MIAPSTTQELDPYRQMQVSCEHCSEEFSVEQDSLSGGSGFVRCPHCQKVTATEGASHAQEVTCENCGTHYAISEEKFSAPRLGVKCGKCGNTFEVLQEGSDQDADLASDELDLDDADLGEAVEAPDDPDDLDLGGDGLADLDEEDDFAALGDDLGGFDEAEPEAEEPSFADVDDEADLSEPGEEFDLGDGEPDFESGLPDEPDLEGLDEAEDFGDMDEEITSEERNLFLGQELAETGPDLGDDATPRKKRKGSKAPFWSFVALLLVVGLVAGAFYIKLHPQLIAPYVQSLPVELEELTGSMGESEPLVRLSILEPLNGRWVTNPQVGRVFVLGGRLQSYYPEGTKIEQVQLTGRLYDAKGNLLAEASNLAGRRLKQTRIAQWNRAKLESFTALNPSLPGPELDLSQSLPFQILFVGVEGNVGKLEAEISSLVVEGQPFRPR